MKKWLLMAMLLVSVPAFADDNVLEIPSGLEVHQGFILPWDNVDSGFMNMSAVTVLKTHADPSFGKWNAVWDGWSIDAVWAFDAGTSSAGLMVGRKLGTLGNYLPIDYPLANLVEINLYPFGILVDRPFDDPDVSGASGASVIKFDVSF